MFSSCSRHVHSLQLCRRPTTTDTTARYFTPQEREGRDTWYFWTGGNEKFWVEMNRITDGNVSLLNYVDSRRHGRRFRELGAITQPGCEAATAPDQHGLWMDRCTQAAGPGHSRRAQRHRRAAEVSEPEVRRLDGGTRRSTCSIPRTCSRRTSSA